MKKTRIILLIAVLASSATLFTGCFSIKELINLKKERNHNIIFDKTDLSDTDTTSQLPIEIPEATPTPENNISDITITPLPSQETTNPQVAPSTRVGDKEPFYGIWCQASKKHEESAKYADKMRSLGFDAQVFITTDWSNLNSEHWYVVTAGVYATKEDANAALSSVKTHCKDAYVKYSGNYQGASTDSSTNNNPPHHTPSLADGKHYVFVSDLPDYGKMTCREGYFVADAIHAGNNIFEIAYSSNLQILTFDPNAEYNPDAKTIPTNRETFKQMIRDAVSWNGYGFICEITVSGGVVTKIEEIYLP